jgi:hypothetical protein
VFNLATGAVTNITGTGVTATATPVANGFYKCTINDAANVTSFFVVGMADTAAHAVPGTTWTPAGTETVILWEAQTL